MSGKVLLKVTQGALAGKTFEYAEKTRIFIGRQEDCGIVMPENTVSRYHCVLEITPPEVKLQDFGSRNGTYLNGEKIGQRDIDQSFEEAKDQEHESFLLHDGDVLGLGTKCEIHVGIQSAERCAVCAAELKEAGEAEGTILEGEEDSVAYYNEKGERICAGCHLQSERERVERLLAEKRAKEAEETLLAQAMQEAAERQRVAAEKKEKERLEALAKEQERIKKEENEKIRQEKEREAKLEAERIEREKEERERKEKERLAALKKAGDRAKAEKLAAQLAAQIAGKAPPNRKKCAGCGRDFKPKAKDNDLCESCLSDRAKVLDAVLGALLDAAAQPAEKPTGPSPLKGYDKISLLGKGGMGEVWKVRERKTGKVYALKTMLPQVAADEAAKQLFLREASVGQCIHHPNVIRTYQSGCANDVFYILLDLCEGGSVDGLMERHGGKLPLELATYIILQALAGLSYVHNMDIDVEIRKGLFGGTKETHTQGVIHRDFKPGNIFLSDKSNHPVAKVADLGMAKAFDAAGLSRMTKTGVVKGTPVFMPRQQAMNFKYAKPEVDVWAAAASYYNMLTGTFPKKFRPGKNVWATIVTESATPIREHNRDIPPKLAGIIDKALVEQPEIGYKSAAELRRDIIAALPDEIKRAVKGVLK